MSARNSPLSAWIGAIVFLLLVGAGALWGLKRWKGETAIASPTVLQVVPGDSATTHRHSFTLGRPARIQVDLDNPAAVSGTLRMGPPAISRPSDFTRVDPAHAKVLPIPAQASAHFEWIDLAVGTRVIHVELTAPAALGLRVRLADLK